VPKHRRRGRRWLIAAATAAVIAAAVWAVRAPLATSPATFASTGPLSPTTDIARDPWYGLDLLQLSVSLRDGDPGSHPPAVKAAAAILVDVDSGRILYALNDHSELAPASTIKLLTALVALTNFSTRQVVTVTPDALTQAWDESKMGLHAGDRLTVQELLTGMLMVSANDAATALAVDTVGMERFVAAMNAEVRALGLHDTHATSPVGLDDPHMYSSAYDLATIADVDMQQFSLVDSIVDTQYTVLPATELHPAYYLNNINLLLGMYPAAVGIKTGYTGNAGGCLVAEAVRGGHRLLSVMLNAGYVYSQSRRLLDWGFSQYGLPLQYPSPSPSPSPSPPAHR